MPCCGQLSVSSPTLSRKGYHRRYLSRPLKDEVDDEDPNSGSAVLTDSGAHQVTDRALSYRANTCPPPGPRVCAFCGSARNVDVGHINGHEEDNDPANLLWQCRTDNVLSANTLRAAGIGRLTRQYNPASQGATSLGQWLTAVFAMKGESNEMTVPAAVAMIRATPPEKRSEFGREIWSKRRAHGTDWRAP
jgi:hypothetical protein